MIKTSIINTFKKSESKSGSGITKILIIILILIITAGVVYWGYHLLFPINSAKTTIAAKSTKNTPATLEPFTSALIKEEPVVKEQTKFEIDIKNREQGYIDKIFVYEPYEPFSNRDPFQKVTNIISEGIKQGEPGSEGQTLTFPKSELPTGTKLSGILDSKDKKVAIIEMNGETFIANLYDIISEKYIVKEIKKDEVIIDFNGDIFSLKIGGGEASNE